MTENHPQDSLPQPDRDTRYPEQPPISFAGPTATAHPARAAYTPPAKTPYVTYTIMGITIFIYLLQMAAQTFLDVDLPGIYGMKVNELIAAGEIWRLFTPMLLHGSILHILFNMYALRALGPSLEQHYGHGRFLMLYILAGFAGNVASFALSANPSLGASTSLFGLFGAEGVFLYHNRDLFGERAKAGLNQILRLAVLNLVISLAPGIDMWGHIGGLAGGVLFAWFAGPVLKLEGIFPAYSIQDRREPASVWLAAAGVGILFAGIAVGIIFFRVG